MKKILTFILSIFTLTSFSQVDTLFCISRTHNSSAISLASHYNSDGSFNYFTFKVAGHLKSYSDGQFLIDDLKYYRINIGPFHKMVSDSLMVYDFYVTDSNRLKSSIMNSYNFDKLNIKSTIIQTNKDIKPQNYAGSLIKRGSNKQIGGICVSIGSTLLGVLIAVLPNSTATSPVVNGKSGSPVAGGVIAGVGNIIGLGLFTSGISDYNQAGRILESDKVLVR